MEFKSFQDKIDKIHEAVEEGDIDKLTGLIDIDKLSMARDKYG